MEEKVGKTVDRSQIQEVTTVRDALDSPVFMTPFIFLQLMQFLCATLNKTNVART